MSSVEALAEVFITAFRSLPDSEKEVIVERLLQEERPKEPLRSNRKDAIQEMMENPVIIPGFRAPLRDEMHDGR